MKGGRHCYPGSDVLINKYDIHNAEMLEKLEVQKVAVKLLKLDMDFNKVKPTFDVNHLKNVHAYLFADIYDWAGEFRNENFFKFERVLSGGSAEYADFRDIESKLDYLFDRYRDFQWKEAPDLPTDVSSFLLELWSIHPFREGNTRTCITFLWHYMKGCGIDFHVELLRNNPMYVRDSLVMANYGIKEYLIKIISDALLDVDKTLPVNDGIVLKEQYRISKADYESFKEKYKVGKKAMP